MNIEEDIKIKLQTIEERLNIQKEILLQEIIDIIIEDISNNKFKFIDFVTEKYRIIQAPYCKCNTKYKNYIIIVDDNGYIFLYKKPLWKKEEIIKLHQLNVSNSKLLLYILKDKSTIIKLMEN